MTAALSAGIGAGLTYIGCVLCFKGVEYCKRKKESAHQQDDIYHISGRVQNQEQWPTHDAHVSIDHINIMNQMRKPAYDDAPPSYDEVMKTAVPNNGEPSSAPPPFVPVVVVVPTSRSQ